MAKPANPKIGDRFQDAAGDTYVISRIDGGQHPHVIPDSDILTNPEGFDWESTWENADADWGPLTPIPADPQVTELLHQHAARQQEIAEIMQSVPPAKHRDFYNTLAAVQYYSGKLTEAQAEVDRISADRGREIQKLVDIVGTQGKAAKLLGTNQSTISRALRNRNNA